MGSNPTSKFSFKIRVFWVVLDPERDVLHLVRATLYTDADADADADVRSSHETSVVMVTCRRFTAMTQPQSRIRENLNGNISAGFGFTFAVVVSNDDDARVSSVDANDVMLVDLLEDERLDDGGQRPTTLVLLPSHRPRGRDLNLGHLQQKVRLGVGVGVVVGVGRTLSAANFSLNRKSFITFLFSCLWKLFFGLEKPEKVAA